MNKITQIILSCIALSALSQATYATQVLPGGNGAVGILTDLGLFGPGTYDLTGSGIVGLTTDGTFLMRPDGLPDTTVTSPSYNYFNPSGSYIADGLYGAAGLHAKIGALIGTFSAAPTTDDWFLIGYSTQVTLSVAGHIYASVNDTYHNNDTGFYEVTVTPVATTTVPESGGTIALLFVGLGMLRLVRSGGARAMV